MKATPDRLWRQRDVLALLFLVAWQFIFFFPVTLGQGLWLGTDTLRTYLPLGVELSRALSQARLPLWTTGIYAGFPLLADGQIGALYPINLLLYRLLPAFLALPYGMLLHLAWAACGMYALARVWRFGMAGALVAGLVFSFSGFFFTRLPHTTIILTAAWLPWLIFLQDRFQRAQSEKKAIAAMWFVFSVLALAAQFLAGFPQIAFLNSLVFVVIGFSGRWLWNAPNVGIARPAIARAIVGRIVWTVAPVILGAGIAAIQLLPTSELAGYSLRGAATSQSFVTSYSLPPAFLSQFVFPFAQGEPSEANNEYLAYFGLVPLVLALLAPVLRRNRQTIFLVLFALGALSLALGELNPVYQLLYRLPGFSLFRVPARYLYLFVFAAALLAATSLDELSRRLQSKSISRFWTVPIALGIVSVIALAYTQALAFWMQAWQVLTWLLAIGLGAVFWLAWTRKIARGTFALGVLGLLLIDLSSYAPAFLLTIAPIVPASNIEARPRSLQALDATQMPGRFYTDESVFPSPPALRGSLFPNTSLIYGKASAQAYSSLALGRHEAYLIDPSPAMLNVANVRYFMVPLEPRAQDKSLTPFNSLYLDITEKPVTLPATAASAIQVTSFTEQAGDLAAGAPVGAIDVTFGDGSTQTFPLRVGIETGDWDGARTGTSSTARIAHPFPAYWRAFGRAFEGNVFLTQFDVALPGQMRDIVAISMRVLNPAARLTIESISVVDGSGRAVSLATLAQKNNFRLAFLSDTVAAWENLDVLPRAFVVHSAQVTDDNNAFALLKEQRVDVKRVVLLSDDASPQSLSDVIGANDAVEITRDEPETVTISVTTDRPGYLVLADSWYPGWNATVDGQATPIYRADILFRAVLLKPGTHQVVFEYRPLSLLIGGAISIGSLFILVCVARLIRRERSRR